MAVATITSVVNTPSAEILTTTEAASTYVPYTAATTNVDLGANTLAAAKALTTEIKTDTSAATDLTITTGSQKTISLATVVWDDLRIVPSAFDLPGSAYPSVGDYQTGGSGTTFKVYQFAKGDMAFFTCQIPHGYKQGEDIKVHVHWTPRDRGTEESGNAVAWKIDYSWANIDAAFGASATVDLTDTCTGTDHLHEITSDATVTGTSKNISSMLICKIYRADVGGDTWSGTTAAQLPVLLEVDFHVPIDTIGSRQNSAK